ncbi:MAG TPA: hypothetical protein VGJ76_14140, partial [Pseudolabrys sp.]
PQLERLELSLLVVRRSVEQIALMVEQLSAKQDQLAAKQDQLSHIATLKSVESLKYATAATLAGALAVAVAAS